MVEGCLVEHELDNLDNFVLYLKKQQNKRNRPLCYEPLVGLSARSTTSKRGQRSTHIHRID